MLQGIPPGVVCFIDANIFIYHLVASPADRALSSECSPFFARIERGEIKGAPSTVALAEAIHKVMLAEAQTVHNLPPKGLAQRLAKYPHLLAGLSRHHEVLDIVDTLGLHVEPVTVDVLRRAAHISVPHQLLTNDATTIATMEKLGLIHLVTNDNDFDSVPGITVWKPR